MIDIMEMLNSRLPIFNFFHQKLIEKYKIEKFTGHWNESFYVYVFVSSLIYILLIIYSFYLLYICLKEQKTKGSGVTYVNGFCDVIFACFCMPCYIVYRGFLNPCKTTQTERVIKETVIVAQPGVGVAQPGVGVAQPGVQQNLKLALATMNKTSLMSGTLMLIPFLLMPLVMGLLLMALVQTMDFSKFQ